MTVSHAIKILPKMTEVFDASTLCYQEQITNSHEIKKQIHFSSDTCPVITKPILIEIKAI